MTGMLAVARRRNASTDLAASYTLQPRVRIAHGPDGRGHYGFPGLCRLPSGRLLAACRHSTGHNPVKDNLATYGALTVFTSDDNGDTWSEGRVVRQSTEYDLRDPTLRLLADGRVVMTTYPYYGEPLRVEVMYSADGGETWGGTTTLPFVGPGMTACSGPVTEPEPGVLMAFGYGRQAGVRMVQSDDNGATWQAKPDFMTNISSGTTEPFGNVRPDGRVEVHTRGVYNTEEPTLRYRSVREPDGTWTPAELVAQYVTGRPSWTINPLTGHMLCIDRSVGHPRNWTIAKDSDTLQTPWHPISPISGQYAQPIPDGLGFCAVYGSSLGGGKASLYFARWIPKF